MAAVRGDHDTLLPRVAKVALGTQVEEVVPVALDSHHYPDLAGGVMKMEHILGNLGAGLAIVHQILTQTIIVVRRTIVS